MKTISIDLETFSSVDLEKCGLYKYAESPDFEILLFGYSVDGGNVNVVDLAQGEKIPDSIIDALTDNEVIKWAYNANFERVCLSRFLGLSDGKYLDPAGWHCTQVWAAYLALPFSLMEVGEVLGLEKQKLKEGADLIKYFCSPCKPTKINGGRTRNLPCHARDKWGLFKKYNKRDVETEMEIQKKLNAFPVPEFVWDEYHLDQEINDRGILIDIDLAAKAVELNKKAQETAVQKFKELTGIDNPNSPLQIKQWLLKNGISTESIDKKAVADMLPNATGNVKEALLLRQELSKTSTAKYQSMLRSVCSDKRARGSFKFYGANRTGRYSGRIIQFQNLPQNHIVNLEQARELAKDNDYDMLRALFDNVPDTLSQLIRTALIPADGYKFIVSDFSAIEARVLAWLAGEDWRMEAFAEGKDIYCASASQMFNVPVEKHGINGHLRQKGKIAELALGYGGGVGALKSMGALAMGLNEDELQPLVNAWRNANPNIVNFWWEVGKRIKFCISGKTSAELYPFKFSYERGFLFIQLPSGRRLAYAKPKIETQKFGKDNFSYMGVGTGNKWVKLESYGPKFVENITQAVARDILCYAIKNLSDKRIVAHVHDELIIECPMNADLNSICQTMGKTPEWASGLILRADGYECDFYRKD